MKAARLLGLTLVVLVGTAAGLIGVAQATHGTNKFSGTWKTNIGEVSFDVVGEGVGAPTLKAMYGTPCKDPTVYYFGDYSDQANPSGKMTACTLSPTHLVGRYRSDAQVSNPYGSFDITFVPPNTFTGFYTADDPTLPGKFAYTGTFVSHFNGDGCCPGSPPPSPGKGPLTATLTFIGDDISIRHGDGSSQDATQSQALKVGDTVFAGPDTIGIVKLSDGSTITIRPMTEVRIATLLAGPASIRTQMYLLMGRIEARVYHKETAESDYSVRTPTATASVRGTAFSVFYDPGSRATIIRVTQHTAAVVPGFGGRPIAVPAGKEIEVTPRTITRPAPIGKADANGGIDRQTAFDRVVAIVGRSERACGYRMPRSGGSSVMPVPGGWQVGIRLTGARGGLSSWRVAGSSVTPLNQLARTIAGGCPGAGTGKAKAGHYSGQTDAGKPVSFDVTGGGAMAGNLRAAEEVTCTDSTKWSWTMISNGENPIGSTLRFSHSYTGPLTLQGSPITNINVTYTLAGTLTATGTATGTFVISHITWDQSGTHYDCTGTQTTWTAKLG